MSVKNYQILIFSLIALAAIAGSTLATITYRNRTDNRSLANNHLAQPTVVESTPTFPTPIVSSTPIPTPETSAVPTAAPKAVLIIPKDEDSLSSSASLDSENQKPTDNLDLEIGKQNNSAEINANQPRENQNLATDNQSKNSDVEFNKPIDNLDLQANNPKDNTNLGTAQQTSFNQPNKSEFPQFRLRLLDAIGRRDDNFINTIVTPETQWNYGGTLNFNSYKINDKQAKFWTYLEKAVSSGCGIDPNAKVSNKEQGSDVWNCPEVNQAKRSSANKPDGKLAVLGEKINVRSEPGTGGEVIDVVSNQLVEFDLETFNSLPKRMQEEIQNQVTNSWTPVRLNNGKRGWIQNRFVHDEEKDYRVSFVRSRGQWRLRYFLPGNGN